MKFEYLKERWYSFRSVYFKDGFIDVYQGQIMILKQITH